jgi:5-methyltetrahydrofolate--homocysteine methyltransferase
MVGGAAVTEEFAGQIGADGWAPDAGSAVILARRLVSEARAAIAADGATAGAA